MVSGFSSITVRP